MKKILITLILLSLSVPSFAEKPAFDWETIDLSNKVMLNIYFDIIDEKFDNRELMNFNKEALKVNKYGIYKIDYKYVETEGLQKGQHFEFGVTIVGKDDKNIYAGNEDRKLFNVEYPLLDVKIVGYFIKGKKIRLFDIRKPVKIRSQLLWDYQQNFMPYKLILESEKETYRINEDIVFKVTLKNLTKSNLRFKDLTEQTLFFLYNNDTWGVKDITKSESKRLKDVVLESEESVTRWFKGSGFPVPMEFEIYCSYVMTYKGVKPSGILKVKVVDEQ